MFLALCYFLRSKFFISANFWSYFGLVKTDILVWLNLVFVSCELGVRGLSFWSSWEPLILIKGFFLINSGLLNVWVSGLESSWFSPLYGSEGFGEKIFLFALWIFYCEFILWLFIFGLNSDESDKLYGTWFWIFRAPCERMCFSFC